jgi:hypothetical protein
MLCRDANNEEAAIWEKLIHPISMDLLFGNGFTKPAIGALFRMGAMELVYQKSVSGRATPIVIPVAERSSALPFGLYPSVEAE